MTLFAWCDPHALGARPDQEHANCPRTYTNIRGELVVCGYPRHQEDK